MKIRDIVNRDIVDLTNCEQEPIHIPGSIQTYGFLLALHQDSLLVDYCSANIFDLIGITYEQCLGKRFPEIFGAEATQRFVAHMEKAVTAVNPPMELAVNGKGLLCSAHRVDKLYVAEFEPMDPEAPAVTNVYDQTIQFVNFMEQSDTLQQLCAKVAEHTRTITGYDRVMVYRFDKDYNGEVFAESKIDRIEPFLGLHYPHTDIPVQARQLYLTNLMRIIVDVNYQPVPIYTIDDATGKNLDLGRSYLRSVSPIHLAYLNNMGVGGTLTISLIHDGRLWGLITCHHYAAKYVPLYTRIAAQMQGHFLTSQINVRQINEEYKISEQINTSLEQLLEYGQDHDAASLAQIASTPALLSLCHAGGAAIVFEDRIYKNGNTPEEDQIRELCLWLNANARKGELNTSRLVDIYPEAKELASSAAGVIYYSLSGVHNDCIIWFAPETREVVSWAGDPAKAIVKSEKGLSPRKSFELWKEITQYESRQWKKPELLATATFAHALQKHITLILISEEEKKQRQLTLQLQEANTELENINWISSHDLKEPLRKIQMFSSRIRDKEHSSLSEGMVLSLNKISMSASRMQQLLSDITAYSKVKHLHDAFEKVDLNDLMRIVAEEMSEEIADKNATLNYDGLPVINGIPFLLKQLFINLFRNSLKFSKAGVAPVISITGSKEPVSLPDKAGDTFLKVTVTDNGIGFEKKHSEDIFKVFTRLHTVAEYDGSGVGLALCRKIMQNHNGRIIADGDPGAGATFLLYFPSVDK